MERGHRERERFGQIQCVLSHCVVTKINPEKRGKGEVSAKPPFSFSRLPVAWKISQLAIPWQELRFPTLSKYIAFPTPIPKAVFKNVEFYFETKHIQMHLFESQDGGSRLV